MCNKNYDKIDSILFHYDLVETNEACDDMIRGALIEYREYNYWRGFIASTLLCLLVLTTAYLIVQ